MYIDSKCEQFENCCPMQPLFTIVSIGVSSKNNKQK